MVQLTHDDVRPFEVISVAFPSIATQVGKTFSLMPNKMSIK